MKTDPVTTGWCPNNGVALKPKKRNECMNYITQLKATGPDEGTGNSILYSHRQVGSIQIWASIAAIVIIMITSYFVPEILTLFLIVTLFLGVSLLLISTLTIEVRSDAVWILFGPVHLVRKKIPLENILGFSRVVTPWYYGWGIRYIKHGTLYNISGFEGVEITLPGTRRIRIGTDDREGLVEAIETVTGKSPSV